MIQGFARRSFNELSFFALDFLWVLNKYHVTYFPLAFETISLRKSNQIQQSTYFFLPWNFLYRCNFLINLKHYQVLGQHYKGHQFLPSSLALWMIEMNFHGPLKGKQITLARGVGGIVFTRRTFCSGSFVFCNCAALFVLLWFLQLLRP